MLNPPPPSVFPCVANRVKLDLFDCRFDQESFQSHQMLVMKANSVVKRKQELSINDLIICPSKCCFTTKNLAEYEKHIIHTGHRALTDDKFLIREGFKKVRGLGHCFNREGGGG